MDLDSEWGEFAFLLLSFDDCLAHLGGSISRKTFERRIKAVIKEFGGPIPRAGGHFTLPELQTFLRRYRELQILKSK